MRVIEDTCLSHVFTLLQYWPNVAFCVALSAEAILCIQFSLSAPWRLQRSLYHSIDLLYLYFL